MRRNLVALFLTLVAASPVSNAANGPLNVCGVRPGMTRAEVEGMMEIRTEDAGESAGVWLYHIPHDGPGCHCQCPRVRVEYSVRNVVESVTGQELRQGWWILAHGGDSFSPATNEPHLAVRLEAGRFVEATLRR